MKNIIYLALNSEQIAKETLVSIESFFYVMGNAANQYRLIIYTNLEKPFEAALGQELRGNIIFKVLTKDKVKQWLGVTPYVYRAKILALIDFVQTYGESALFIDSDTFFISDITPLFSTIENQFFLMNYPENQLSSLVQSGRGDNKNRSAHRFFHDIYQKRKLNVEEKTYHIASDMPLWNAGIIGVPSHSLACLYDALALSDFVFDHYHLRTAEQFALACVLQKHAPIVSGDNVVFHYWFLKEARYLLENVLGISSELEDKYLGTSIIKDMDKLKNIDYNQVQEMVISATRKKWGSKLPSLLEVISPQSYLGQILRKNL